MNTLKLSKFLIAIGAFFLIFSGFVHLYFGYTSMSTELSRMEAPIFTSNIIKAVWIIFSSHLFLVSVLLFLGLVGSYSNVSFIAILCGLIPILDGAILTYFAGPWNLLWALPGVLVLLGGILTIRVNTAPVNYSV